MREWIYILDELPPKGCHVLFFRSGEIGFGYFGYHFDLTNSTHWMPLPGPPNE